MYVAISAGGQLYARCIPAASYGSEGRTEVYEVGARDSLLYTYDWYAPQVFLQGYAGVGVAVIQTGPWPRGQRARRGDLALAIYRDGALLKRYSTLDIAGRPDNVSASESHYAVFEELQGFRADLGGFSYFQTETIDHRSVAFDLEDGQVLTPQDVETKKALSSAGAVIGILKYQWYEQNRVRYDRNRQVILTKAMLMSVSGGAFPPLPAGYEYVPGPVWGPPEFRKTKGRK